MVDAVAAEKNLPAISKGKKKRPDGLDLDRYKNINAWKYKRWAWEFLRRNSYFIADCKKVDSGTNEEKQKIADEYGLKKFKKYTESYKGESGYPRFSIGSITSWTNLESDKEKDRRVKVKIGAGQVLIRFDFASAINDKKSITKQFRLAEERIEARLQEYEKLIKKYATTHKHKPGSFGIYIRLLDHLALKKTPLECAKLIYPTRVRDGYTDTDLRPMVKDPISAAIKMAEEGYKYLSLLEDKPKCKGMPLEF